MKQVLFLMVAITLGLSSFSQDRTAINPFPKTINVSGSAEMEIVPDEIYVQVDLKEYKKKSEPKVELDKIKNDFLAKCKSVGIADSLVSIASYEGANVNYWQYRREKKDPDMLSGISYQIKFSDSKKMDQLVEVLDDEATTNFRVARVSHSRIVEYRKQLKIQAIKAAKDKGIYLAEAINEKVGEAVTITEPEESWGGVTVQGYRSQVVSNAVSNSQYRDANENSIDFKKFKLRYEVNVVFALK